jgi:hypothetical protein
MYHDGAKAARLIQEVVRKHVMGDLTLSEVVVNITNVAKNTEKTERGIMLCDVCGSSKFKFCKTIVGSQDYDTAELEHDTFKWDTADEYIFRIECASCKTDVTDIAQYHYGYSIFSPATITCKG